MNRAEEIKRYAGIIARHKDGGLEALEPASVERLASGHLTTEEGVSAASQRSESLAAMIVAANSGLEKLKRDRPAEDFSPPEMDAVEAIIFPEERPAVDVIDGNFHVTHPLWLDLNQGAIHDRLVQSIPSIGRIGLPGQSRYPYAGTGFVVGEGLLMTNRHVAEIFASGLGTKSLSFRSGWSVDIDFLRERGRDQQQELAVHGVRMIHPYWDMALLEVEGLSGRTPLQLSLQDIGDLDGRRVAAIGYPAYDPQRNDIAIQNQLFSGVYGVKRLQPGRLHKRRDTGSFKKLVSAGTHDCSTLGGNSGSAVVDLDSGEVLGLHFGGRFRDINYFVPAFELARDGRVVDAAVSFAGSPSGGTPPWSRYWDELINQGENPVSQQQPSAISPALPRSSTTTTRVGPGGEVSFTIPLTVTVQLGASSSAVESAGIEAVESFEEKMAEPWRDTNYTDRKGYNENFLANRKVPLPKAADASQVAPTLEGKATLHYGNFSVQMHAARRLALFTASNVTGEKALRKPEPGKDYTRKGLSGLGENDMEKWFPDPRLDAKYQLSDRFYTQDDKAFDKGHIVRRDDVAWGASYAALRQANGDSYHITNCSPQVSQYNQSARGQDNWGDLENLVLSQAVSERYCVFAGPILDPADETFVGKAADGSVLRLKIPQAFWKVVVAPVEDGLAAYAFVLDQDLSNVDLEFAVTDAFRLRMTSIAELERKTGLVFPAEVRKADRFDRDEGVEAAMRGGIKIAPLLDVSEGEGPSPNPGDDEAAAQELGTIAYVEELTEAPASFRIAKALDKLRTQVNTVAPNRSKKSDGWIGDPAHQSRSSDHNPWIREGETGIVTALDVTHDPAGGCDAGKLAEALRTSKDKRIKYLIWNRRIANREAINGAAAWAWRPYSGTNPHTHHVHISVRPEKVHYDAIDAWAV
jgi:endonuclease G